MKSPFAPFLASAALLAASSTVSAIDVSGELTARPEPYVWDDTSQPYVLVGHLTVNPGATLEIRPSVRVVARGYDSTIYGNKYIYDLTVDGTLEAMGARFAEYTDIKVRAGGTLRLANVAVSGGNATQEGSQIQFQAGSAGTLRYSQFMIPLALSGEATLSIQENDFASSSVTASGSSAATIDLTRNWWGTTDATAIGQKITDYHDPTVGTRPIILFDPPLPAVPGVSLLYVMSCTPIGPVNALTGTVQVTFNRDINPATFKPADARLTLLGQSWTPTAVEMVQGNVWRVSFANPLTEGSYTLEVGPQIADGSGNLMDQDLDGNRGEPGVDALPWTRTTTASPAKPTTCTSRRSTSWTWTCASPRCSPARTCSGLAIRSRSPGPARTTPATR